MAATSASANTSLLTFFTQMENQGGVIVKGAYARCLSLAQRPSLSLIFTVPIPLTEPGPGPPFPCLVSNRKSVPRRVAC